MFISEVSTEYLWPIPQMTFNILCSCVLQLQQCSMHVVYLAQFIISSLVQAA